MTFGALMSAFSLICLYTAAVMPTGQLGFVGATAVFGAAAVVETGAAGGAAVFAVTAALGFFLLPDKSPLFIYLFIFGYYPVVKVLAERLKNPVLRWIVKLLPVNAGIFLLLKVFTVESLDTLAGKTGIWLVFLAGSAIMILFDVGLAKLTAYYAGAVSPKIRRR